MKATAFPGASPSRERQRKVMEAWERFVDGGEVSSKSVRNLIERSWGRCHSAGIDPAGTRAPDPLSGDALLGLQNRYRDLIGASVSIMAQARDLLSESGTIMILTDPTGVILQREGDPAALEAALDIRLTTG